MPQRRGRSPQWCYWPEYEAEEEAHPYTQEAKKHGGMSEPWLEQYSRRVSPHRSPLRRFLLFLNTLMAATAMAQDTGDPMFAFSHVIFCMTGSNKDVSLRLFYRTVCCLAVWLSVCLSVCRHLCFSFIDLCVVCCVSFVCLSLCLSVWLYI